MEKSTAMQGVAWSVWGGEAISVIFDLRWALALVVVLLAVDFWWGKSESSLLYAEAKKANNHVGMETYRFRWSRAIRRTINKLVDYTTFLLLGTLAGLAITEQYDLLSHTQTAAIAILVAMVIEIMSIWGHVKVVRRIGTEEMSLVARIARILIGTKSKEIAEVIDQALDDDKEKENN